MQIIDVTAYTLGIEGPGEVFVPLIPRNTPITPYAKGKGHFYTVADNQTRIIPLLQCTQKGGKSVTEPGFIKFGEVVIDGITPAPKRTDRFEVTPEVGNDGLPKVHIADRTAGKQTTHFVQLRSRQTN